MSENPTDGSHPGIGPPEHHGEFAEVPRRHTSTPKISCEPAVMEEWREDIRAGPRRPMESIRLLVGGADLEGPSVMDVVEVASPALEEIPVDVAGERKRMEDQIARLESEIEKMHGFYQGVVEGKTQDIRATEERLKLTERLLETKAAELTGARAFLSTADRLSEVEVLDIVRDLNENIYQVAVNLTDEWEKMESSEITSRMDVDPTSRPRVPSPVQRVLNRDPTRLTFQLQSCLCSQVAKMTSSWGHHQELAILESVHQSLSASEGQAISARWRSLAYSYLSRPPPRSALLVEQLAKALDDTGSFPSTRQSIELVQSVALEGIESIIQLSLRLELAFKVEVTSSDVTLLFEAPGTVFDGARMIDEFGYDGAPVPRRQDKIAGTTEVGVGKSVCGRAGKSRRTEILSKTKVVLEKDVIGS